MKHQIRSLFGFALLVALAFSSFGMAASAKDDGKAAATSLPPVPALLECRDKTSCDRDPEHFKKFVEDFYKWYETGQEKIFNLDNKHKSAKKIAKEMDPVLREYLTPEFYRYTKEYKTHPVKGYCNADPFVCWACSFQMAQEPYMTLNDIRISDEHASADVTFGAITGCTGSGDIVKLKPLDGAWKIEGVLSPAAHDPDFPD